jgi:hypothetical protein
VLARFWETNRYRCPGVEPQLIESFRADMGLRGYRPKTLLSHVLLRVRPEPIPRTPAACAFRQAPLGPAVRAQNQEVVPRAPRPHARLTNAQIAGVRGIRHVAARIPIRKAPQAARTNRSKTARRQFTSSAIARGSSWPSEICAWPRRASLAPPADPNKTASGLCDCGVPEGSCELVPSPDSDNVPH